MLKQEMIHELVQTTVAIGLDPRSLLAGINPHFVSMIQRAPSRASQVLIDLDTLDRAGVLSDGSHPLATWLKNAELLAGPRVEAAVFRRAAAALVGADNSPAPSEAAARSTSVLTGHPRHAPEVVCLTALGLEYDAVREHLHACREEVLTTGTIAEVGAFSTGSREIHVAIVEAGQNENVAAGVSQEVITHFRPKLLFFIGVAGGIKDVQLGDVVAGTKIYGYESGKAEIEFRPRPDVGQSAYRLVQRARAEARLQDWLKRLPDDARSPRAPRAHIGAIAAGSAVIASTEAPLYKFLRAQYGDALAVEMEGRGFLETAYRNQSEAMVVRGISDLIEEKGKADSEGWQPIAARNAAAFAFEVIAKVLA